MIITNICYDTMFDQRLFNKPIIITYKDGTVSKLRERYVWYSFEEDEPMLCIFDKGWSLEADPKEIAQVEFPTINELVGEPLRPYSDRWFELYGNKE